MLNLMTLEVGTVLKLINGATVEVVENLGDGQWVTVKYLKAADGALIGQEEMCHSQDIASLG